MMNNKYYNSEIIPIEIKQEFINYTVDDISLLSQNTFVNANIKKNRE